jgi:hypothetical protein
MNQNPLADFLQVQHPPQSGYCVCGKRISANKALCLACVEKFQATMQKLQDDKERRIIIP